MRVNLRFSGSPVESFTSLIGNYGSKEFDSPQRSTVPSLAFWMDTEPRVTELCELLKISGPSECTLEFEHKVPPPEGTGNASHTDVMISWQDTCIGVEAKYTEPPYEKVGDWLRGGKSDENRKEVLGGWCGLIGRITGKYPDISSLEKTTYQMIHRIASVCSRSEKNKYVLFQVFYCREDDEDKSTRREKIDYYRTELSGLCKLFEAEPELQMYLSQVSFLRSWVYDDLVRKWRLEKLPCSQEVQSLLSSDMHLNQFRVESMELIK